MGSDEYRATQADVDRLRTEIEIYEGLFAAVTRWPEVSMVAFEAETPDDLVERLCKLLGINELQAQTIADMQIRRLSSRERSAFGRRLDESRAQLSAVLAQLRE